MQISEITAFLEHAYDVLNDKWFDGELPHAVITIQSTPGRYGHFTLTKAWWDSAEGYHEINLGAETLNRDIENVICTLIHEMVHFSNLINGIKDVSRGNTYHNARFKEEAEKRGLLIDYDKRIGFSITSPAPELIAFIKEQGWQNIDFARTGGWNGPDGAGGVNGTDGIGGVSGGGKKKKSSTRTYRCEKCGCSVRATKVVNVGCLDCGVQMQLVEK